MDKHPGKKYSRSEAYDKLYALACRILDKSHACSKCPIFQKDSAKDACGFSKSWCCDGCPHLNKETGCTVDALLCRIHLCAPESKRQYNEHNILRKRMTHIKNVALSYNLLLARASKEQTLKLADTKDIWFLYRRDSVFTTGPF